MRLRKEIPEKYSIGDIVKGKVATITDFGAFIDLGSGLEGLLHISEISHEKVEKLESVISIGQILDVKILKLEPETRKIGLSLKGIEKTLVQENKPQREQVDTKVSTDVDENIMDEVKEQPDESKSIHTIDIPLRGGRLVVFIDAENLDKTAGTQNKCIDYTAIFNMFKMDCSFETVKLFYFTSWHGSRERLSFLKNMRKEYEVIKCTGNIDSDLTLYVNDIINKFDSFILFAGDGGYIGLIQKLKKEEKYVEICFFDNDSLANVIRRNAPRFVPISKEFLLTDHAKETLDARSQVKELTQEIKEKENKLKISEEQNETLKETAEELQKRINYLIYVMKDNVHSKENERLLGDLKSQMENIIEQKGNKQREQECLEESIKELKYIGLPKRKFNYKIAAILIVSTSIIAIVMVLMYFT